MRLDIFSRRCQFIEKPFSFVFVEAKDCLRVVERGCDLSGSRYFQFIWTEKLNDFIFRTARNVEVFLKKRTYSFSELLSITVSPVVFYQLNVICCLKFIIGAPYFLVRFPRALYTKEVPRAC